MTLPPFVDTNPTAMSPRARVYLYAGGFRHLLIGLFLFIFPWLFSATAFIPIFNLLSLGWWAGIMVATGLTCIIGAFTRRGNISRAGMVASASVTLVLGVGLLIGVAVSWWNWIELIGWDALGTLILEHPDVVPASLLLLGPAPPSPFLPIVMLAVTIKDYAVCAQPLRVPFEDVRVGEGLIPKET